MTTQNEKLLAITEHLATMAMETEGDTYIMAPNPTLASETITWFETVKLFTYDEQDWIAYRMPVDKDNGNQSAIIAYQPSPTCITKLVNMSVGELRIFINFGRQSCDISSATMFIVAQRFSELRWKMIIKVRQNTLCEGDHQIGLPSITYNADKDSQENEAIRADRAPKGTHISVASSKDLLPAMDEWENK
jgi:hypothetical protein